MSETSNAASPVTGSRPAPLVLASASPRRHALLAQIGITPDQVTPADLDENQQARELPRDYALRVARAKAAAVAEDHTGAYVLAADTVVACGRRILPKAEDETTARECLGLLSGRRHRVLTAVALVTPDGRTKDRVVETAVRVKRLSAAEIDTYVLSGEWLGKAGGYAIQGRAAALVPWINGSYSNVVGLPLAETHALLLGMGWTSAKETK